MLMFGFCSLDPCVSLPRVAGSSWENGSTPTAQESVLSPGVPCWPMWANIAVPGCMGTQLGLGIKERAREWTCSPLGFIHCVDGCNWTFSAEQRGKKPERDAAPAKHPCPWQQHLLMCSGGTSSMVPPHCWALQQALLCTPSWWAVQHPLAQGQYWLWERCGEAGKSTAFRGWREGGKGPQVSAYVQIEQGSTSVKTKGLGCLFGFKKLSILPLKETLGVKGVQLWA